MLSINSGTRLIRMVDKPSDTPRVPLLEGVQRAHLIAEGVLTPRDIPLVTLSAYDRIALVNAMMPWAERLELPAAEVRD